jgi:hypothetical protein
MPRTIGVILVVAILVVLPGCARAPAVPVDEGPLGGGGDTEPVQEMPSGVVVYDEPPDPLLTEWIDIHRHNEGAYQWSLGGIRYVLVAAGERPTGGYAVKVDEVRLSRGVWLVDVVLVEPGPGDNVTQALTYPFALVSMDEGDFQVQVRRVTGEGVEEIPVVAASPRFIVTSPIPGTQVQGEVRVTGAGVAPGGSFRVLVEDGHMVLGRASGTTSGDAEWGRFDLVVEIGTPANPYGAVVIYTENPQDGSITEELILPVRFGSAGG